MEQSVAIAREVGDTLVLATCLRELDLVNLYQGDLAAADRHSDECIVLCRAAAADWDLSLALFNAGYIASALEDNARAVAAFEESLALLTKVQDEWGVALVQGRVTKRAYHGTFTGTRMAVEHAAVR
jgi:hypothetical protein